MNLKRPLRGSESGADVRMVQRALNAAPSKTQITADGIYGETTKRRMRAFRRAHSLSDSSQLDQAGLDALWPYFDAYGRMRYRAFRPPPLKTAADVAFEKLLAAMQQMAAATPGYLLGGEHGIPLSDLDIHAPTDCSSSCSWVLWRAGLFGGIGSEHIAAVSGQFESWGLAGAGKYLTVYANWEHVFIRLHKGPYWRFDTSPHGDGGRGPRLRRLPRFTSGFTPRHPPGM